MLIFIMIPMLLKDIVEEQLGIQIDETFLMKLADFNGHLFASGLA